MLKIIVKHNHSPRINDVINILVQFNDYEVIDNLYRITVTQNEIKVKSYLLLRLMRIIKNWRTVSLYWNDKELTQYHMFSFGMYLLCSMEYSGKYHCLDDGKKNWGCKYINAVLIDHSDLDSAGHWYNYGEFIDKENTIWKINKNDILNTLLNQVFVEGIFICPMYREEILYSLISQLPDTIDLNKNKEFKRVFKVHYDHEREYIENKIIHIDDDEVLKLPINNN